MINQIVGKFFVLLIRAYQYLLSPWIMPACRFTPSCSQYGVEAIQKHGAIKGGWLGVKRACSCHPLNKNYGYDPVPDKF